MTAVVYYREGLGWATKITSSVGVSAGNSVFPTKEEAIEAAQEQYPDEEIVVEE